MKKYLWTLAVLAIFAVGFAASDEEENSSVDSSSTPAQTEKSENKEKKEKQEQQLSPKEKEVAEAGANQGSLFGMAGASNEEFSNMLDVADYVEGMDDKVDEIFKEMAGGEYDKQYGSPTNGEEKKLKKIYIEHFIKAMNNTMDGMDALEKLGGKR
jgi:hypothetical protein